MQWIIIAYGLMLGGFLLLGGRMADLLGRRRFFAFIFLGSLLMQQVLGYSPTRTGVAWLATTGTSVVAAGSREGSSLRW